VRGYILCYLITSQVPTEPIVTSSIRSKFSLRGGYSVAVAEDPYKTRYSTPYVRGAVA
jgi:hypothetical protein